MSEGLTAVMHETVAPSDDELINELTEKVDETVENFEVDKKAAAEAAEAKRAEYRAKLEELDEKPEVDVKGTITEEAVAGEKAGEESAPDRALLRDRLVDVIGKPEEPAPPADPALDELRAISQRMVELQQQQITGKTPQQLAEAQNTPDAIARQAHELAQKAQAEAEALRTQLAEREQERRVELIENQIVDYVKAQGDKYPLVNDDNQKLVSAAMFESVQSGSPMSEDEAIAHVEGKLRAYVEKSAARLGWTAPGGSNDGNSSNGSTKVAESSLTKENTGAPAPTGKRKTWDEMSDEERDDALLNLL